MSSSLDGTIKFWKKEGALFVLDKEATENMNGCFNPNGINPDLKIMFMNFKNFGEDSILAAGTSDNRLLFWFGQNMNFKQVVFDEKYVIYWIFTE